MKKALLLIKNWYKSITEPFELIKDNFGSLVAYEVLFRVLAFLVLLPNCLIVLILTFLLHQRSRT